MTILRHPLTRIDLEQWDGNESACRIVDILGYRT